MDIEDVVIISDTHFGCQFAVCPPKVKLNEGGTYHQNKVQKKLYNMWNSFFNDFLPDTIKDKPFIFVHNGDIIDGTHHNSITQISHSITDQIKIACDMLAPIVKLPNCKGYYQVRGTEAHAGKSHQYEEDIAIQLNAIPNEAGIFSRHDLWIEINNKIINFSHHIGVTNSSQAETGSLQREIAEFYIEAGRYNIPKPNVIVRSHKHRFSKIDDRTTIALSTPAWQAITPFVWKSTFGRTKLPQIGGVILQVKKNEILVKEKIWNIEHSKIVKI